jgi:hypothetical protein
MRRRAERAPVLEFGAVRRIFVCILLFAPLLFGADFLPVSVWYGGGKARAPIAGTLQHGPHLGRMDGR